MRDAVFVTGASGTIGGDVLARLLAADPRRRAWVLVRDAAQWPAVAAARGIDAARTEAVTGDLRAPDLGLDPGVRARIAAGVGLVLHAAADTSFSQSLTCARAVNVAGTSAVVRLAEAAGRDVRLGFVSTAFVAGRRTGRIHETDAVGGAGWVNAYEQSKAEAEAVVRAYRGPWTIFRPSTLVYDAAAEAVRQTNAVHRALRLCWHGLAPMLPGAEDSPVDVVTSDYVADAIAALLPRDDVGGVTLHLCAGDGALALGELLDRCWRAWSHDRTWRRRGLDQPALAPLEIFRLFERSVRETGDDRLRRVLGSLTHFAPQLALPKAFDTTLATALLGHAAPTVRSYWTRMLNHLIATGWAGARPHPAT